MRRAMIAWPQIVGLIAATITLFVAGSNRSESAIFFQMYDQLIDESALTRQYLSTGPRHAEIGDPVDFGKVLHFTRTGRPFHLELVAGKPAEIEISLHRESVNRFPALLTEWCERYERTWGREAGFLVEFAFCASQQIAGFDVAFRD